MHKYILSIFLVLQALFSHAQSIDGIVNYIQKDAEGVYIISANGYGKSKENAYSNAEKNLLNAVLFQGFPGTEINTPLVSDDDYNNHIDFFKNLNNNMAYEQFVLGKLIITESKNKKTRYCTIQYKINYSAFR